MVGLLRFRYCGTHIKDEEYMNKMSKLGYQAKSLVEGFWTFENDNKIRYTYRVYYFRGMNKKAIANEIIKLEKRGIEFVSRYSFWGIFRSKKDFYLYSDDEQLKVCYKIRKPMVLVVIMGPFLIALFFGLGYLINKIFFGLVVLMTVYYLVCLYLMIEYTKLIKSLEEK